MAPMVRNGGLWLIACKEMRLLANSHVSEIPSKSFSSPPDDCSLAESWQQLHAKLCARSTHKGSPVLDTQSGTIINALLRTKLWGNLLLSYWKLIQKWCLTGKKKKVWLVQVIKAKFRVKVMDKERKQSHIRDEWSLGFCGNSNKVR